MQKTFVSCLHDLKKKKRYYAKKTYTILESRELILETAKWNMGT